MSATSVGVAPSGECLWGKGRCGSCGWQVKLWDRLAVRPYLSWDEMSFMTKRYTNLRFIYILLHFTKYVSVAWDLCWKLTHFCLHIILSSCKVFECPSYMLYFVSEMTYCGKLVVKPYSLTQVYALLYFWCVAKSSLLIKHVSTIQQLKIKYIYE